MKEQKKVLLNTTTNIFQHKCAQPWNPCSKSMFKSIIPRVFMHNELTTDGCGMCIVELLSLHGILTKTNTSNDNYKWVLTNEWEKRQ